MPFPDSLYFHLMENQTLEASGRGVGRSAMSRDPTSLTPDNSDVTGTRKGQSSYSGEHARIYDMSTFPNLFIFIPLQMH